MGEVIERTGELIRDPEAWSDAFDEVPVEDRLDFLVETFKYPLDDEFLQAVDMGGILIDLEPAVLPQPFADLVRTIRDRAPALHGREIPYLEGSVLAWELFCREGHRLEKTCQYLLQVAATHPSWFLRAFRWLKFYGENGRRSRYFCIISRLKLGPASRFPLMYTGGVSPFSSQRSATRAMMA